MTKKKYEDRMTEFVHKLAYTDISWQDEAACQRAGNEIFFADPVPGSKDIAEAKSLCKACNVRWDCLQFALRNDIRYGVWGGFTPAERSSYLKGKIRP